MYGKNLRVLFFNKGLTLFLLPVFLQLATFRGIRNDKLRRQSRPLNWRQEIFPMNGREFSYSFEW